MWRRQFRRRWPDTPWHNKEVEGSEKCWVSDWVLTEAYMFTEPTHAFWKTEKCNTLYVRVKKPGPCPKGWRGRVVLFLHSNTGGGTDGEKCIMLLRRMEKEWTPIVLNTWDLNTISGCLEANIGGGKVQMGFFAPIKDKVC